MSKTTTLFYLAVNRTNLRQVYLSLIEC